MTTVFIEDYGVQSQNLIEHIRSFPFATVVEKEKKSFKEAANECNAVSVDAFFDELDERIKKRFNANSSESFNSSNR
jgi:hypothetical protein